MECEIDVLYRLRARDDPNGEWEYVLVHETPLRLFKIKRILEAENPPKPPAGESTIDLEATTEDLVLP